MKFFAACVVSTMLGLAHADVPTLFCQKPFTSDTLAKAVNHYVAMGETAAIKELQELSAQEKSTNELFQGKGFSVDERIGWVCRILYEPRGHSPLQPPKFGVLSLPEKSMPVDKWPLYPVALSGSTYFVLKQGYTPSGNPELLTHYLSYCQNHGVFRHAPVNIPTQKQAAKDAVNLRQCLAWQAIEWECRDGFSFPLGEPLTFSFIHNQARAITAEKPLAGPPAGNSFARVNSKPNPTTLPTTLTLR